MRASDPRRSARVARVLALTLAAACAAAAFGHGAHAMDDSQIRAAIAGILNADSADEEQRLAYDLGPRLKEAGVAVDVRFLAPNVADPIDAEQYLARADAYTLLTVSGEPFLWRPEDKANVSAFMLE